jgi:hypothetical protein
VADLKRNQWPVWTGILINANAEISDVNQYDGNEWRQWDSPKKYNFIAGFISATGCVISNNVNSLDDKYNSAQAWDLYLSYVADGQKQKKAFSHKEVKLLLNQTTEWNNDNLYRYAIIEITNGQLVEGLNLLFDDFKNKQIKVRDAIYVVKKQIKGASPEEIEATLQYLRADKDLKKLWYTDKDGGKKYLTFP